MNLDITKKRFALLYIMYACFQNSYYHGYGASPDLFPEQFKRKAPVFVIDCSRQDESFKAAAVNVRLQFEAVDNFSEKTTACCMIIHYSLVEYTSLSNTVRRLS